MFLLLRRPARPAALSPGSETSGSWPWPLPSQFRPTQNGRQTLDHCTRSLRRRSVGMTRKRVLFKFEAREKRVRGAAGPWGSRRQAVQLMVGVGCTP